jgi:hypothetical protein
VPLDIITFDFGNHQLGHGRVETLLRRVIVSPKVFRVGLGTALVVAIAGGVARTPSAANAGEATGAAAASLPCDAVIGAQETLRDGQTKVTAGVALPTGRALQANRSGEDDPDARLFAKSGLLVRPGSTFELVVPRRWRQHLTIAWGGTPRTSHLLVSDCGRDADTNWLAYAGGYYVDEPACVTLIVRAKGKDRRVRIGIGAACPGQPPPPPGVG